MRILVTNDDGIVAKGLWALATALKEIGQVIVVAPSGERSACGTAVTLLQPLEVEKVDSPVPGIEAYAVDGTPSDSVILALGKLAMNKIDLVVTGINNGPNLGDDVFISGTVGAALQGYVHGLPALAVSIDAMNSPHLDIAAKVAALLAKKIADNALSGNVFLNVNVPSLSPEEIKGVKVTSLANQSHGNSVAIKEAEEGEPPYYWLIRQRLDSKTNINTDINAIEKGIISITPLHIHLFNRQSAPISDGLFSGLLQELQGSIRENIIS